MVWRPCGATYDVCGLMGATLACEDRPLSSDSRRPNGRGFEEGGGSTWYPGPPLSGGGRRWSDLMHSRRPTRHNAPGGDKGGLFRCDQRCGYTPREKESATQDIIASNFHAPVLNRRILPSGEVSRKAPQSRTRPSVIAK